MNPNQIITRLNTWYRRRHPLHAVLYDKEMGEGEVADLAPLPDTLTDTWHNALAMIPWPGWVPASMRHHFDRERARCLLECIWIDGVDQVPTGPGIVALIDSVHDAGRESPVCFHIFQREHPPIFRVRALTECRFVLALMCDLCKPQKLGES